MSNDPVSQMREYMLERLLTDKELREINRTLTHGTQILYDHIATLKAELDAARQDTELLDRLDLSMCSVRPYEPWRAESEEEARWHVHNPAIRGRKAAGFNAMTVREAIARALDAEDA
jgi:hypothetical protein